MVSVEEFAAGGIWLTVFSFFPFLCPLFWFKISCGDSKIFERASWGADRWFVHQIHPPLQSPVCKIWCEQITWGFWTALSGVSNLSWVTGRNQSSQGAGCTCRLVRGTAGLQEVTDLWILLISTFLCHLFPGERGYERDLVQDEEQGLPCLLPGLVMTNYLLLFLFLFFFVLFFVYFTHCFSL